MSKTRPGHTRPTIAKGAQQLTDQSLLKLKEKNYTHPHYDTSLINLNSKGKLK